MTAVVDAIDPATLAWAGKFSNVPSVGAPAAAAGGEGAGDQQPPPAMTRISMDKVAQLDADITANLLGGIDKAMTQMGDLFGLAALAKVDFRNPQGAVATLRKLSRVSEADRNDLKHLLAELGAAKHILDLALDEVAQQNTVLRQARDELLDLPVQTDATTKAYEAARDLYEHVYDATIQATKFALEIVASPPAAILELLGTDLLKDLVKGGNSDELVGKIQSVIVDLGTTINQVIAALGVAAATRARDAAEFIQTRALPRVTADVASFAAATSAFNMKFDAIRTKAMQAAKGAPSDSSRAAIVQLYQGIVDANTKYQEARIAVEVSKSLRDLSFWGNVLVPLGSLVKEDDRHGQSTSVLYRKGGTIYCFFLPVAGLRHSFEDLSAAVDKVLKLETTEPKDLEKLCDAWMKAMVDAL